MNRFSFKLLGKSHNNVDWPKVKIYSNNDIIYDDQVIDYKTLDFDIETPNTIKVELHSKRFGENNIWDTVINENGEVIDLALIIKDIVIDNCVSLLKHMDCGFIKIDNNKKPLQPSEEPYLAFNSEYILDITDNVLMWTIHQINLKNAQHIDTFELNDTHLISSSNKNSNTTNYEQILSLINEIEYKIQQL